MFCPKKKKVEMYQMKANENSLSTFCELLKLDGGVMGGQGNKNMVRKTCELKCRVKALVYGFR